MYDCNEFNNLAGILMALPAPLTVLMESEGLHSVHYVGFPGPNPLTAEQVLEDAFQQRADLVAISASSLVQNPADRNRLIAKSRDQLSQRVLLELPLEDEVGMTDSECLALGFVRLAQTDQQRYYLFDLKTYKPVPDWLNPKFWANPQNWDKYRW